MANFKRRKMNRHKLSWDPPRGKVIPDTSTDPKLDAEPEDAKASPQKKHKKKYGIATHFKWFGKPEVSHSWYKTAKARDSAMIALSKKERIFRVGAIYEVTGIEIVDR